MAEKIKDIYYGSESTEDYDINDMLGYEFMEGNELWLHIYDVRDMGFGEKLKMLREGFKYLASLLKSHERFDNIDVVSGTSWIVTKNPKLMERLGFTIDNNAPQFENSKKVYYSKKRYHNKDMEDIEPSYAYISKDKFIELYGQ